MKRLILSFSIVVLTIFISLYFVATTKIKTIVYYTNGNYTVTRIDYDDLFGTYICSDFYYGRLKEEEIDENKCFIRCEISNGAMMGIIHFREDSIFIVNIEGDFYKFNCNTDKLYLKKYDHESGYDNLHYNPNHVEIKDMVYFSYGLSGKDQVEINEENGLKIEVHPAKKTYKFFNVNKSDACEEL